MWLVKTGEWTQQRWTPTKPALGLGPELALTLLEGLHRDAKELGDDTLTAATRVYLTQYALVLGQQGGRCQTPVPWIQWSSRTNSRRR